jgi:ribosomal protein S18 acetylase RimI-like enzyme
MTDMRILDVTDEAGFARIPPCADPGFDHRTCDYWEDDRRGSKAARLSWLEAAPAPVARPALADNPFAPPDRGPAFNPFDPKAANRPAPGSFLDPFADDPDDAIDNPFAPKPQRGPTLASDAPRKLQLLARGKAVFGSYAKVLEADGAPAVYCQFGPLSAYPRAQRVRDLYPKLPSAPLPAVITCIATTPVARERGLARALVEAVVEDLTARGFSAVEAYPEPEARPNATSVANPAFWRACGFDLAIDDERFPVVRREL